MTTPTITAAKPTVDEIRDAIKTLTRAWAPPPAVVPVEEGSDEAGLDGYYDSEEYEWTNGCGCGGVNPDESGEPFCNCAGGCGCKSCVHSNRARYKTCSVRECGKPSQFKIVPWCLHRDGYSRAAEAGDPATNENGSVALGDSRQDHTVLTACGTIHARELITADQADRGKYPADSALSADRTHYDVSTWTYEPDEPDELDVPGAIHRAADQLGSAHRWAKTAIQASYPLDIRHRDFALEAAEQNLAWAAAALLEYREHLAELAAADDDH